MSPVNINTSTWTPIGPAPIETKGGLGPISGRIEAAAPHPTNPSVLYVGGANGGIWKSTNPVGWVPLTDDMPSLNFSGYHPLVVHPSNHNLVLGAVSGPGAGILKSTDGGVSWQLLANSQFDGQTISSIAVHPTDTNIMYISVGWQGVWKSKDGGASFQQLSLPGGNATDVILAKYDPTVLFAGVVGNSGAAQPNNGVHRSTDSGATWHLLSSLPSGAVLGGSDGGGAAVRLESGSGAGVVYVAMLTLGPNPTPPPAKAVTAVQRFKTTDGGTTWKALAATPGTLEARSWHLLFAVAPKNDAHVFANGPYSLYESTDSGKTWTEADTGIGYLSGINHFDWVNMAFNANGDAIVTADQGVLQYQLKKKNWTSLMGNLQVSQFYTITLDPNSADVAYAVGQDIFSEKFTGTTHWNVMEGGMGETGRIWVDPKNSHRLCAFNPLDSSNFVLYSTDAGSTWTNIFSSGVLSGSFLTTYGQNKYGFAYTSQKAFALDRSNPDRVLVGFDQVFETTDAGSASPTWKAISNVLSKDPNNTFIVALVMAPSDGDTVYASTQDGRVWVTYNNGVKWSERDSGLSGTVVDIRVDPADKDHVFAVTNGAVWELSPSTLQWSNITHQLPTNFGFNTIFVDWYCTVPGLFVGTGRGIYRSDNLGHTWAKFSPGLPNTSVSDLQGELIHGHPGRKLVLAAGTFGRGAWEILVPRWGAVSLLMADTGNFGQVCVGSFTDEVLTISNSGCGVLEITDITSSSPDFIVAEVLFYPLTIGPGDSLEVPIRFQPSGPAGFKSATLTVISNDPTGPRSIKVSGEATAPRLSLMIANDGNFGKVCAGSFVDEPLILNNSGRCTLFILGITSSSADFVAPQVQSYPLAIAPGASLPAPIRFAPAVPGPKSATITVFSNDPAGNRSVVVSGETPTGKLAVTGSTCFGGVKACCSVERTISICNVGECSLHVTSVAFKRKSRYWKLINNPFPATLRPGSCLCVVIRYWAAEKCPRASELVITSDDPTNPVKVLDVMAYTDWNDCGCKQDCDECRKSHKECGCKECPEDCCDDGHDDEDEK